MQAKGHRLSRLKPCCFRTEDTVMQGIPSHRAVQAGITVTVSQALPDWGEFLADRGRSGIYEDPRWGDILRRCYGNRPYYLTAWRDHAVAGALLLVAKSGPLFASHLCSVPYFDAVGVIGEDADARAALLAEACHLRRKCGAAYVELRQWRPLEAPAHLRTDKVSMWLDLPPDAAALWSQVRAKVRNQVRKGEKAGAEQMAGGAEHLNAFHAVYARNMRDLGSPPHSRAFFARVLKTFGSRARLYVVTFAGRPVAASLILEDRGAVHVPWAASDWRYRRQCPNYVLYWAMLRDACGRVSRFDFGRSTRDAGTHAFKKHWGAREVPLYWQYLFPGGAGRAPSPPAAGRPQRVMVACWKRLPVPAARALGPWLIGQVS